MTGSQRSSTGLDERRRRLLFRAWHRGTREMDLVMGRFADSCIGEIGERELADYERLIELPDPDLYALIVANSVPPAPYDTALLRRMRDFHRRDRGGR